METETRDQILIKCRRAAVGAAAIAVAVAVAGLFLFRGRDKLATTTAGQTASWIRQCLPFAAGNEPGMRRCCRCCKLLLLLWLWLLLSSRLSTGSNNWVVYRWMDWMVWQLRLYLLVDARGQRNATLRFLANGYLRTLHKYSKRGRDSRSSRSSSSSSSRSRSGSREHRHANPLEHLTDHIGPGQMNSWHSLSVSLFLRLGGLAPFCCPFEITN